MNFNCLNSPSMFSLQLICVLTCVSLSSFLLGQVWCQIGNCGTSLGPPREGRQMGAEDAEQGTWPWMVALMKLNVTTGVQSPICSGFLIDNRHVLSAAHCFGRNQPSLYSARIGHVNLTYGDEYPISHIAVHEDFKEGEYYDDIALITLSKDVEDTNINSICLPSPLNLKNLTGRGTTVVGWGATTPGGPMHLTLKQLSALPIVSNEFCELAFKGRFSDELPLGITSGMICAEFLDEPGKDSCLLPGEPRVVTSSNKNPDQSLSVLGIQGSTSKLRRLPHALYPNRGDSGGPLMIQQQNRWYAVGVASFGFDCGAQEYPGVYTSVSKYLNWIYEKRDSTTRVAHEKMLTDAPDFHGVHAATTDNIDFHMQMQSDASIKEDNGIRFGSKPYCRQEFSKSSDFRDSLLDDSIFALEFKTLANSGVMFYVGGVDKLADHIVLFMQNGKITFMFNCGSGSAVISSRNTFNDGKWHQVVFWRNSQEGRLVIDEEEEFRGTSPGTDRRVNVKNPFYVGGISENEAKKSANYLNGIDSSFPGYIRNVEAQDEPLQRDTQTTKNYLIGCSSEVDKGTFSNDERHRVPSSTPSMDEEFTDAYDFEAHYAGQCVLPLLPRPDTSVKSSDGVRYGNSPYSREEFSRPSPGFLDSILDDSIFALQFKTSAKSGVLFYVGGIDGLIDHVGLVMKDGKIVYVFNCGSGSAVISSQNTYNDGKWHQVVFWRHAKYGRLVIDDEEEVIGTSPGTDHRMNIKFPFYVGGISENEAKKSANYLQGISLSFPGCIRKVEAQSELLDTKSTLTGARGCSNKVEEGSFFYADGGYIVLYDKYHFGQGLSITLDIKPRNLSGVLMAVHGRQNYFILQLVDGRVEFTVDNGSGPATVTYAPDDRHHLCDGQFHTIRVDKSNTFVTLSVDKMSSEPGRTLSGGSSTNTLDPLFMGGLPESSLQERGVRTKDSFVGCMRNLELNQKPESMAKSKVIGHVTLNSCPTI